MPCAALGPEFRDSERLEHVVELARRRALFGAEWRSVLVLPPPLLFAYRAAGALDEFYLQFAAQLGTRAPPDLDRGPAAGIGCCYRDSSPGSVGRGEFTALTEALRDSGNCSFAPDCAVRNGITNAPRSWQ